MLTALPKSWLVKKVQQKFCVSGASQSKKLVEKSGILSLPGPSHGTSLPPDVVFIISSFYESDDISCAMPGKDFLSVKEGKCEHIQKRLIL